MSGDESGELIGDERGLESSLEVDRKEDAVIEEGRTSDESGSLALLGPMRLSTSLTPAMPAFVTNPGFLNGIFSGIFSGFLDITVGMRNF